MSENNHILCTFYQLCIYLQTDMLSTEHILIPNIFFFLSSIPHRIPIAAIVSCHRAVRAERAEEHTMNGKVKNGLIMNHTSLGQVLLLPSGHPSQPSGHHQVRVIGRERLFGCIPLERV